MNKPRYGEKVGYTSTKPIPLRLRHPYIPRFMGGSEGSRGPNWAKIRAQVLARDKNRSTTTGMDAAQGGGLQVDHIMPYRLGGKNKLSNLRTTDNATNRFTDNMTGARERKPRRDARW